MCLFFSDPNIHYKIADALKTNKKWFILLKIDYLRLNE